MLKYKYNPLKEIIGRSLGVEFLEGIDKKIRTTIKSIIEISRELDTDIENVNQYQGYCEKTVFILNQLLIDIEAHQGKLGFKNQPCALIDN